MKRKFSIKSLVKIFALGYVCCILIQQQITMGRQKEELQNVIVEKQKQKDEKKVLQDEKELSKSDKYIEKKAREMLGLIKEGETPVMDKKK